MNNILVYTSSIRYKVYHLYAFHNLALFECFNPYCMLNYNESTSVTFVLLRNIFVV